MPPVRRRRTRNRNTKRRPELRRQRRSRTQPAPNLGQVIAKGVRHLTTYLPGQTVVRPIVDYIYRALGFSKDLTIDLEKYTISGTMVVTGLAATVFVKPQMLLSETKNFGFQTNVGSQLMTSTNFRAAKFQYIKFTATPIGKLSDRRGNFAMAFVPLWNRENYDVYQDKSAAYDSIAQFRYHAYANASRSLTLKWNNRGTDGFASLPQDVYHNHAFGVLLLSFSDEYREAYGNISVSEFANQITISCAAEMADHEMADLSTASGFTMKPDAVEPKSVYCVTAKGTTYTFEHKKDTVVSSSQKISFNKAPVIRGMQEGRFPPDDFVME